MTAAIAPSFTEVLEARCPSKTTSLLVQFFPAQIHRQAKAIAFLRGITLREFVVQALTTALAAPVSELIANTVYDSAQQTVIVVPAKSLLTPRETEIGRLLAEGLENKEIAVRARLTSDRSIKAHISRMALKLNLRSRGRRNIRTLVALHFVPDIEVIPTEPAPFSARNRNLLRCIVKGMNNREIGLLFGSTEQVIKNEMRFLSDKAGMTGRLELALWAVAKWGKKLNFGPPWSECASK